MCHSQTQCDADAPQSLDGTCNNLELVHQGAVGSMYRRGLEGAEYKDGLSARVTNRPMERYITNFLGEENPDTAKEDPIPHNMLAVFFGQFVSHDFALTDVQPEFVRDIPVTDPNDQLCLCDAFCALEGVTSRCTEACLTGSNDCPRVDGFNTVTPGNYFISGFLKSNGEISAETGQFEVGNLVTSYLDLSMVYGNDEATGLALRELEGGRLKADKYEGQLSDNLGNKAYSFEDLPPKQSTTGLFQEQRGAPRPRPGPDEILTSGDKRTNQHVALAGWHTLFLREHNYWADIFKGIDPDASDELLFQAARRRNIAHYQKIVLEDHLPAEFGEYFSQLLGPYQGYDSSVDATTGAAFATAAFRYGHSALRPYKPLGKCGEVSTLPDLDLCSITALPPVTCFPGELPLLGQIGNAMHNVFAHVVASGPDQEEGESFETIFRSLIGTRTRPIDAKMDDNIRHIYVPRPFPDFQNLGTDLLALDIRRGRDNGIPNYNSLREVYHPEGSLYGNGKGCGKGLEGLDNVDDPLPCFVKLVANLPLGQASAEEKELALALKEVYGKVNRIDAAIGLLVEAKVPGSSFGETEGRIIVDQYRRFRDGDRFWYQNVYGPTSQTEIQKVTMKTLLERHFNLPNLPEEVFLAPGDMAQHLDSSCA